MSDYIKRAFEYVRAECRNVGVGGEQLSIVLDVLDDAERSALSDRSALASDAPSSSGAGLDDGPRTRTGVRPTDETAERCGANALMWAEAFCAANGGDRALLTDWFTVAIHQTLDLMRKAQTTPSRCVDCRDELRGIAAVAVGLKCDEHREVMAEDAAAAQCRDLDEQDRAQDKEAIRKLLDEADKSKSEIWRRDRDLKQAKQTLEDIARAAGLEAWSDGKSARATLVEYVGALRRSNRAMTESDNIKPAQPDRFPSHTGVETEIDQMTPAALLHAYAEIGQRLGFDSLYSAALVEFNAAARDAHRLQQEVAAQAPTYASAMAELEALATAEPAASDDDGAPPMSDWQRIRAVARAARAKRQEAQAAAQRYAAAVQKLSEAAVAAEPSP